MGKILIVDDDAHIRELVRVFLRNDGFEVIEASDGVEALAKFDSVKVDMAVIGVRMPKMDGWELCQELKANFDTPVLMLTVKGETSQKLKGLQLGMGDYLVKPFEPLELVTRVKVKALLKCYRIESSQKIQISNLTLNRRTYQIAFNGENLTLPLKEFELLFKLANYPGRAFSRHQPTEGPWNPRFQHGGPPTALFVREMEQHSPRPEMMLARVTIDILGPIPLVVLCPTASLQRGLVLRQQTSITNFGGSIRPDFACSATLSRNAYHGRKTRCLKRKSVLWFAMILKPGKNSMLLHSCQQAWPPTHPTVSASRMRIAPVTYIFLSSPSQCSCLLPVPST